MPEKLRGPGFRGEASVARQLYIQVRPDDRDVALPEGGTFRHEGGRGSGGRRRGRTPRGTVTEPAIAPAPGPRTLLDGGKGARHGADEPVGFGAELRDDGVDLLVHGLQGDAQQHHARKELLQDHPVDPGHDHDGEEQHQHQRQPVAELEAAVKEDEHVAQEPEPEMALHPGGGPADAPRGHLAPDAQRRAKQDESKADRPVDEAGPRPPSGAMGGRARVRHEGESGHRTQDEKGDDPAPLARVEQHALWPSLTPWGRHPRDSALAGCARRSRHGNVG